MVKTIIALYRDTSTAQHVVEALLEAGFSGDDLSLLVKDKRIASQSPDEDVRSGDGAGFGALVGALVGLGSALMPGIGPLIGGGVLAVVLTAGIGAAAGALTGGITASVFDLSLSEEEAAYYADGLRWGGTVVSLTTKVEWLEWAQNIMLRHEPLKIEEREAKWYDSEWSASSSPLLKALTQSADKTQRHGSAEFDSSSFLNRRVKIYKYDN